VVELVFELEVDAGFVDCRVSEDRLVNIAVCGENVVAPMLGEEYFDGERLVDACSFERDVGERRVPDPVLIEPFKRGDDEPRGPYWMAIEVQAVPILGRVR